MTFNYVDLPQLQDSAGHSSNRQTEAGTRPHFHWYQLPHSSRFHQSVLLCPIASQGIPSPRKRKLETGRKIFNNFTPAISNHSHCTLILLSPVSRRSPSNGTEQPVSQSNSTLLFAAITFPPVPVIIEYFILDR